MYKQKKAFDLKKAGNKKGLCLQNVRLGYGVPAKYDTATEAWKHTEQHKDRNFPVGVDAPLYFSYTTTIDGVRKNYGHIGVRLAKGQFWSDGIIYPNLDTYLSFHAPKYLGWGESVNDVKVIKEVSLKGKNIPIVIKPVFHSVHRTPGGKAFGGVVVAGQKYIANIDKGGWAQITFRNKTCWLNPNAYKRR